MLTFCNSYVLWLLRCVQLRLVTVTFCDVNVVWCYVFLQYRQICSFSGYLIHPIWKIIWGNPSWYLKHLTVHVLCPGFGLWGLCFREMDSLYSIGICLVIVIISIRLILLAHVSNRSFLLYCRYFDPFFRINYTLIQEHSLSYLVNCAGKTCVAEE